MSASDIEEQKSEILAIQEICDSENVEIFIQPCQDVEDVNGYENVDFFKQFEAEAIIGGRIKVSPTLHESLRVTWTTSQRYHT